MNPTNKTLETQAENRVLIKENAELRVKLKQLETIIKSKDQTIKTNDELIDIKKSTIEAQNSLINTMRDFYQNKGIQLNIKTPPELLYGDINEIIKESEYLEKLIKVRSN